MRRLVLSVAKPNRTVAGQQPTPQGFAVLSPTYSFNRSHGRATGRSAAKEQNLPPRAADAQLPVLATATLAVLPCPSSVA